MVLLAAKAEMGNIPSAITNTRNMEINRFFKVTPPIYCAAARTIHRYEG